MQYLTVTLLSLLAALTTAAPTKRDTYYGVGLELHLQENGKTIAEPAPVQLNTLTALGDAQYPATAYEIVFDGSASNIDVNSVECRAYKDAAGVVPGSAPFTKANPAELATPNNPVEVGSVLCYVVETE
ncbi:MAG: hypothetical protein M1822_002641 [Bathelium mastoideum]|nr:MAG: hypothetical protein M1822_002641 [Bathelium mastoideum]